MKEFWNERYGKKEFAYGENPTEYLKAKLSGIPIGKVLFPAEGEGRNAVFAATHGWDVFAFDQSEEGKKKAELLAQKNGVQISYIVSDMEQINYPQNTFDALALIYAHFSYEKRKEYHQKLGSLLKKGGVLILEGFGRKHTEQQKHNPTAGGPRDASMLYDLKELKSDFEGFEIIEDYEVTVTLDEGLYHNGQAEVIRLLAIKK